MSTTLSSTERKRLLLPGRAGAEVDPWPTPYSTPPILHYVVVPGNSIVWAAAPLEVYSTDENFYCCLTCRLLRHLWVAICV